MRDTGLQFQCFGIQHFQFLVERFQLFLEIFVADFLTCGHTNVAAWIETPSLRFDLGKGSGFAQAGDVAVTEDAVGGGSFGDLVVRYLTTNGLL